jgi:hypothetical protein
VSEYVREADKPFIFLSNEEVYFGKCRHFR